MMSEIDQIDIEQKQKLLKQHRRNLSYLEQQAVKYGLDVPLAIHNALSAEQDEIAKIERDLVTQGVASSPQPEWQALVIDADTHWREIIAKNVGQLGGAVIAPHAFPAPESLEAIEASALAIVGVPGQAQMDASSRQWIENVVKLGQSLPLILLASWDNKETAIALRQAICEEPTNVTAVTIFKENFDPFWFSRIVHKILTH
jgi:hypothetical protein